MWFSKVEKIISFSLRLKIFNALSEDEGIIGYNKKQIFLIISSETYIIVFNLIGSFFLFQGSSSLKYLLAANNELTINRNSHKIQGVANNLVVTTERAGFTLVYYNATQGWVLKDRG